MKQFSRGLGAASGAVFLVSGLLSSAALAAPQTLSFNVAARISSDGTAQNMKSRVFSKGNRVRLETVLGGQPVVFLAAPPYLYKLIPASKAGVRWKNDRWNSSSFDLQRLIRNPKEIRTQLKSRGAKSAGTQKLGGILADVLLAKNFLGSGTEVKAWLRRGDALPMRLEARAKSFSGVVTWSDYRHDAPLADALFQVPSGYNVRQSQGRPGLM